MIRNIFQKRLLTSFNLNLNKNCLTIYKSANQITNSFNLYNNIRAQLYNFSSIKKSHLINPYNKELVSDKQYISDELIVQKLNKLTQQQKLWKNVSLETRIQLVSKFANSIINDQKILRQTIANQIGKSYKDIQLQFKQLKDQIPYLFNAGFEALKADSAVDQQSGIVKILPEPIGLVLFFPHFSQPIFDSLIHLIPCLISGCGAVIKSSDYNHFLGQYLQKKAKQILQHEIVADIFIQPQDLTKLSQFKSLKKIIFSGSHSSAKHIFEVMAEKRFVDCNMFFGGQDAAFIDQTANLEKAINEIIKCAFGNNGQSYDSIKRLYIKQQVYENVINKLKQKIMQLKLGDPKDESTNIGPLAIPQAASGMEQLINEALSLGAKLQIGGMITSDQQGVGIFFEPTLLTDISNQMSILQTQTPAPILCCISVVNEEQFIESVNDNRYGAAIKIFTKQDSVQQIYKRYQNIIKQLEVGKIIFNQGSLHTTNKRKQSWSVSSINKKILSNTYEEYVISKVFDIHLKK